MWKTPWQISCYLVDILGTLETNYYQGKQSYRTVTKIIKKSAETGVNNYVQSISETKVRLWWHDYGDKAYKERCHQKLASIQHNICLALSWAIRRSSRENFYHEFGLKSPKQK